MNGPAKNGALIYSHDIKALSQFYIDFFTMHQVRETSDFISLVKDGFNIIIHNPPSPSMPESGFNTVKLFLTVESLEQAKIRVKELGGQALEGLWSNSIFSVCNITDIDGNHIQIREFAL
jgi:predicted enzyme related to lactoylglutathione lyase